MQGTRRGVSQDRSRHLHRDVKLPRAQRALRRLIPIVDSADEQLGEDFSALLDVYLCYVPTGMPAKVKEERTRLKAAGRAHRRAAHTPPRSTTPPRT